MHRSEATDDETGHSIKLGCTIGERTVHMCITSAMKGSRLVGEAAAVKAADARAADPAGATSEAAADDAMAVSSEAAEAPVVSTSGARWMTKGCVARNSMMGSGL